MWPQKTDLEEKTAEAYCLNCRLWKTSPKVTTLDCWFQNCWWIQRPVKDVWFVLSIFTMIDGQIWQVNSLPVEMKVSLPCFFQHSCWDRCHSDWTCIRKSLKICNIMDVLATLWINAVRNIPESTHELLIKFPYYHASGKFSFTLLNLVAHLSVNW